jgi:ankyrin repeat protein
MVASLMVGCSAPETLEQAAEHGPEAVEAAIARGGNVDAPGISGRTPLQIAADHGDAATVARLLAHGARVDERGNDGTTPLQLASRRGASACIGLLAHSSHELDAFAGMKRRTALHDASLAADAEGPRVLLHAGADPNARDGDGKTALHLVAAADPYRTALVAPVLLDGGADPKIQDARGFAVLHAAAFHDNPTLVRLVIARARESLDVVTPLGENALDVALRWRHDAAAEALLAAGATPRFAKTALPPLHDAARCDDLLRASALVGLGADTTRVWDGKTALDLAHETKSVRVEALLRSVTVAVAPQTP